MSFGENLKQTRKAKGFTQEELAEKLNVSRQAISKWEAGGGYPETEKLLEAARVLNVSLDFLLDNVPAEGSGERSGTAGSGRNRILITVFDGSRTVDCISVSSSRILFPGKNEPEYILEGVDRTGILGDHKVVLGWYDGGEEAEKELKCINDAMRRGRKTYQLKYFTPVEFRGVLGRAVRAEPEDPKETVPLTERGLLESDMLSDVLAENGIPFLKKGKMGAGLAMKAGPLLETNIFYVTRENYGKARQLMEELFAPKDGAEGEEADVPEEETEEG